MTLDKRLIGKKATIYYDRHIISCIDSSSSNLNTITGNIEDIYDSMIAVSYLTNKQVRSTQKGIFFDKVSYEEKKIIKTVLINIRYIVKIELLS